MLIVRTISFSPQQANGVSGNGPESIRAAISSLNLKNTKVDLSNGYIDAQKSTNNGVVVVVVGQLSFPGGPAKPFVQSFLLSNQVRYCCYCERFSYNCCFFHFSTCGLIMLLVHPLANFLFNCFHFDNHRKCFHCLSIQQASSAYYVSNSVFRLLVPSEEQGDINSVLVNLAAPAAYTQPAAAWTAPESQPASVASPAPEESSAASSVDASGDRLSGYVAVEALLQEAANEAEEVASAPEVVSVPEAKPTPAPVVEVTKPVVAAPAAPVDPLKKLNYSDIVKKINSGAAPVAPAAAPAVVHRAAPTPVAAPAPAAVSSTNSVYIKQVPEAATSAELHALFSAFGNVVNVDQQAGKSFAFVKFDSAAAVQAAVQATSGDKTLSLHGQNLRVEERNVSRPAGSSSGAGANSSGNNGGRGRERDNRDRSGRDGNRENRDRDHKGGDRSGPRRDGDNRPRDGNKTGGSRPAGNGNTSKAK